MTIIYNLEGPKGSGKSTLIRRMIERGLADRSRGFSGQWENLMTDEIVSKDHESNDRIIHDRGYFSHFIYTFLMSAEPDFNRVKCDGPKVEILSWRATNIQMIKDYMDKLEGKMIILYSDFPQILIERIKKRQAEESKGATSDEWSVLDQSNQMFSLLSSFMKTQFPDKVLVYRIEEFNSPDELIDRILEDENGEIMLKFNCRIFNDDETLFEILETDLDTCRTILKSTVLSRYLSTEDVEVMNHAACRLEIENRLIDCLIDQIEKDLELEDLQSFYHRKMSKDYNDSKNWSFGIEVIDL